MPTVKPSAGTASGVAPAIAKAAPTGDKQGRISLARRAYEHLKDALLEGRYRPGERLNVDLISKELKVSRAPVMETLKQLEVEQLVVITPQVGCSVVVPGIREISDHFRFMARTEGFIAELAAERGSKDDLDNLTYASSQIGVLLSSSMQPAQIASRYRTLNRDFHNALHHMAAAPELTANVAKLFDRNDFFIALAGGGLIFSESIAKSQAEHEAIVQALLRKDLVASRKATERHIARIHDRLMAHMRHSPYILQLSE